MIRPRPPRFLARQTYRRRRLTDAARILPVVGLFLFLIPILWQPAETPAHDTASGGIYLFGAWFVLIVAAFLLSRALAPGEGDDEGASGEPPDEEGPR